LYHFNPLCFCRDFFFKLIGPACCIKRRLCFLY